MKIRFILLITFLFPSILFSDILLFYGTKRATLSTISKEGWVYVSLDDLKKVFNISTSFEKRSRRFILNFPEHSLIFVPENPYYLLDTKGRKMFLPFLFVNETGFVSLPDIESVLAGAFSKDVFILASLNSIVIDKETFNPDSIIVKKEDNEISFTLSSRSELITSIDDDKKGTLKLTLHNAVAKPTIIPHLDENDDIKRVVLRQKGDRAILSFYYNPQRIEKIEKELTPPAPSIKITFFKKKEKIVKREKPKKKRVINKIVIDPGHGGKDPGAVGPSGLTEKEVALKIAKKLKQILIDKGFSVLMTRDDDSFVHLKQRSRLANNSGADLFISIHCNASVRRKTAGGFETYFLSTAKTDWARAVEAKENSVIKFEAASEKESVLEYILWDMAQNEYLRESSDLAECIQESMGKNVDIEDRGVKQANFYVMREIYMPSVLVETSFITSVEEEKLLKKKSFREKIAEGIADGILKFKKTYEKKLNQ